MKHSKLEKIVARLSQYFNIPPPQLELWDDIPSYFWSNVPSNCLNQRGNGFYRLHEGIIVLETFNPRTKKEYSDEAMLYCLAHEYVHYMEDVLLGDLGSHKGKFAPMVRKIKCLIKKLNYE